MFVFDGLMIVISYIVLKLYEVNLMPLIATNIDWVLWLAALLFCFTVCVHDLFSKFRISGIEFYNATLLWISELIYDSPYAKT